MTTVELCAPYQGAAVNDARTCVLTAKHSVSPSQLLCSGLFLGTVTVTPGVWVTGFPAGLTESEWHIFLLRLYRRPLAGLLECGYTIPWLCNTGPVN